MLIKLWSAMTCHRFFFRSFGSVLMARHSDQLHVESNSPLRRFCVDMPDDAAIERESGDKSPHSKEVSLISGLLRECLQIR